VIPPPRRFDRDPGIRRVQAGGTAPPPAGPRAESAPEPVPTVEVPVPGLGLPAAERLEPTEAEAEAEAVAPAPQVTTLLMRALKATDSPVRVYGWVQNSYTGNANGRGNGNNFGVNPNFKADQWMGNQYYLVVENPLELNDTVNFGFRIDQMIGNDWQFNYMQGLFNRAYPPGHFPGYDLSQLYGEVHLPILTPGGLDIRGGLFYTLAGYEQVPAIARPLLSVPYMFNYGQPFRHVGLYTTLHLTPNLNLFNGTINGWDRWLSESYIWGYIGGFAWTSRDKRTQVAFTCVWGPNQFPHFLGPNQPIYPTGYINIPSLAGHNPRLRHQRPHPVHHGAHPLLGRPAAAHPGHRDRPGLGAERPRPGVRRQEWRLPHRRVVQLRQLVPLQDRPGPRQLQADRRLAERGLLGPHRRPHRLRRHLLRDDPGRDLQAQGLHLDPPRSPLRLGSVRHPL
jgi:hypothetical protein